MVNITSSNLVGPTSLALRARSWTSHQIVPLATLAQAGALLHSGSKSGRTHCFRPQTPRSFPFKSPLDVPDPEQDAQDHQETQQRRLAPIPPPHCFREGACRLVVGGSHCHSSSSSSPSTAAARSAAFHFWTISSMCALRSLRAIRTTLRAFRRSRLASW